MKIVLAFQAQPCQPVHHNFLPGGSDCSGMFKSTRNVTGVCAAGLTLNVIFLRGRGALY